jgi:type I restriction enzyme M protein
VNKKKAVSNGNYLWISYFYSYLNEQGRSGFVMSSQASGAGRDEAKVRRKIIETGHVDVMISIRSNFFYTRSVPCELWFIDRGKPDDLPDQSSKPLNTKSKVLMIDARNVYRQITRKIYDFSPEQMKNLTSIVWLYRGQNERFLSLVAEYLDTAVREAGEIFKPLEGFKKGIDTLMNRMEPFLSSLSKDDARKRRLDFCGQGQRGTAPVLGSHCAGCRKKPRIGQADRPNIQARISPH